MRVELSERVEGVAPGEALAWWMDFREGRVDHAFVPGAHRRVLDRSDSFAVLEETVQPLGVTLFRERLSVHRVGNAAKFEGTNNYAEFEGEYVFEESAGGTLVRLVADVRLRKPWVAPKALVEAVLKHDLRWHAREMRKDLKRS